MLKYNTQQRLKKNPQRYHTKSLSLLIPSPRANATRNKLYETNKIQKELDYVKKSLQCDTRETIVATTISSRNTNPNSRCFSNRTKRLNCSACEITSQSPTQIFVEKGDLVTGEKCHIFKCELCDKENICVMQTVEHCDTRMCLDCYKIVLESETTSQQ